MFQCACHPAAPYWVYIQPHKTATRKFTCVRMRNRNALYYFGGKSEKGEIRGYNFFLCFIFRNKPMERALNNFARITMARPHIFRVSVVVQPMIFHAQIHGNSAYDCVRSFFYKFYFISLLFFFFIFAECYDNEVNNQMENWCSTISLYDDGTIINPEETSFGKFIAEKNLIILRIESRKSGTTISLTMYGVSEAYKMLHKYIYMGHSMLVPSNFSLIKLFSFCILHNVHNWWRHFRFYAFNGLNCWVERFIWTNCPHRFTVIVHSIYEKCV